MISLNGSIVTQCTEYTYLGVKLDQSCDPNIILRSRANLGNFALARWRKPLSDPAIPIHIRRMIYLNKVRPVFEYAAQVIPASPTQVDRILEPYRAELYDSWLTLRINDLRSLPSELILVFRLLNNALPCSSADGVC